MLLDQSIFELIPMKRALEKAGALPEGATVSVTASPDKGMSATIELSIELARRGFRVIPHLSARGTKTRADLEDTVRRLEQARINQVFVVGGDAPDPGDFFDALEMLTALAEMGHPFEKIGVAGYPEGHPTIPNDKLMDALVGKLPHASYIATQMCFDAQAIEQWTHSIRDSGVDLPIKLGVPGAVDTVKLLRIGARIGMGQSLRYLKKNVRAIRSVLVGGISATEELLEALAPSSQELGIDGLHIFTFNAIAETTAWREKKLSAGG